MRTGLMVWLLFVGFAVGVVVTLATFNLPGL